MKKKIHPQLKAINVTCVCGAKFETISTQEIGKIDICSNCHPFYTGKQKVIDTEGRIEKFKKKFGSRYSTIKKKNKD